MILEDLEDSGCELRAETGKHEYSARLKWKTEHAYTSQDIFSKMEK
jgi:hypothetical protein